MALAGVRLAGWLALGAAVGVLAGTATVRGMNEASAYAPPAAGTESAALAQIAAETMPPPQAAAQSQPLACPDCSDRTNYIRVTHPEQYAGNEQISSEDEGVDTDIYTQDNLDGLDEPEFSERAGPSY